MFVVGHLGIGRWVSKPLVNPPLVGLEATSFFIGAIFPDILDKSLYYLVTALTGLHGSELTLITGSRTFGHAILLSLIVLFISRKYQNKFLYCFSIGMFSHLFLDQVLDLVMATVSSLQTARSIDWSLFWPSVEGLFWPILGFDFPVMPYGNMKEHLESFFIKPEIAVSEIFGALILVVDFYRSK